MKRRIRNFLLKNLFNSISEYDIICKKGKYFFIGDDRLPDHYLNQLEEEAKAIQVTDLWKYLLKDAKYQANKQIYVKSRTEEDIYWGKALLWAIDILETKVKELAKDNKKVIP
jgi:hypothetical protein